MLRLFILVVITLFVSGASCAGPIIEVPSGVDGRNPYCWMRSVGLQNLNSSDCNRTCTANSLRRVCIYEFVQEYYQAMGAACGNCANGTLADCMHPLCYTGDGTERGVMAINRRSGPDIQVCQNDIIVVKVINQMGGTASTIHWHGILQRGTPWMDGVAGVSQCAILDSTSFRYVFPAEDFGTYLHHSHTGLHKANGVSGPLIVRRPKEQEPARNLYSEDKTSHVVFLKDYAHDTAEMFYPGLPTRPPGIYPYSFLVNGFGRWLNPATNQTTLTPLATFHVTQGISYRFRLINAASYVCPMQFQIEGHNMTVIAVDGSSVVPRVVDAIVTSSGERVDFIVTASNTARAFWIHVSGILACRNIVQTDQVAVLSYNTLEPAVGIYPPTPRPTLASPLPVSVSLNHPNTRCGASPSALCITDLQGLVDSFVLSSVNVTRVNVTFGNYDWTVASLFGTAANPSTEYNAFQHLTNPTLLDSGVMNSISHEFPATPTMYNRVNPVSNACNQQNKPSQCRPGGYCRCVHIIEVPCGAVVEMIFTDISPDPNIAHPIHLHGFKFYVMEMVQQNQTLSMTGSQSPNGIPPQKDTVLVPSGGSARVRFLADNSGDWLLHCHLEWHLAIGMSLILRVQGLVPYPPPNFPICGNFDPITSVNCY